MTIGGEDAIPVRPVSPSPPLHAVPAGAATVVSFDTPAVPSLALVVECSGASDHEVGVAIKRPDGTLVTPDDCTVAELLEGTPDDLRPKKWPGPWGGRAKVKFENRGDSDASVSVEVRA